MLALAFVVVFRYYFMGKEVQTEKSKVKIDLIYLPNAHLETKPKKRKPSWIIHVIEC